MASTCRLKKVFFVQLPKVRLGDFDDCLVEHKKSIRRSPFANPSLKNSKNVLILVFFFSVWAHLHFLSLNFHLTVDERNEVARKIEVSHLWTKSSAQISWMKNQPGYSKKVGRLYNTHHGWWDGWPFASAKIWSA